MCRNHFSPIAVLLFKDCLSIKDAIICRNHFSFILLFLSIGVWISSTAVAQPESTASDHGIRTFIQTLKTDPRGPYQSIRWFCPDGSTVPADQRCVQPGGIQHALAKDRVTQLAADHHLFLGQILAGTSFEGFWDAPRQQSRLKQYLIEKYLQSIDDGWILSKARFYRGAIQAEDEEAWGLAFLKAMATRNDILESRFFLLRQACRGIPHFNQQSRWPAIRALAKNIADEFPPFTDLRVKLHGHADAEDIHRVEKFMAVNQATLPASSKKAVTELLNELNAAYAPVTAASFEPAVLKLPKDHPLQGQLQQFVTRHFPLNGGTQQPGGPGEAICRDAADLLLNIRKSLVSQTNQALRLTLLDLSISIEEILFQEAGSWQGTTLEQQLDKVHTLAKALTGCGFLELWEWDQVSPTLTLNGKDETLSLLKALEMADTGARITAWGAGMARAVYGKTAERYSGFEPLAKGFVDDQIRSSPLLALGLAVGELSETLSQYVKTRHHLMGISPLTGVRGVNPGFAMGELVVADLLDHAAVSENKIYVLAQAPADLNPVAGIATVSEGNLVSHVQLLARNLGIPNAVVTGSCFKQLAPFTGQPVFYAVSPKGTVLMKSVASLTPREKELVTVKKRSQERIAVPIDRLNLDQKKMIPLKDLAATDSGRVCGPKAANLGQLKALFPEAVVDGFVIPFGVFREHMEQSMPGTPGSYWQYLQQIFAPPHPGEPVQENDESKRLAGLKILCNAVKEIPLMDEFTQSLSDVFSRVLHRQMGEIPVFVRSDTNMEDLKEFTGAGLNLTVFNVRDKTLILQAIRDVWASVYTERSYSWRQKYLDNPENVFPSILILPTVNVDTSGVMITSGMGEGGETDFMVAFSRGAGGAVDGQSAESYLVQSKGRFRLLSPARESEFKRLPETGGVENAIAGFHQRLLSDDQLHQLMAMGEKIKSRFGEVTGTQGPYDIELGFQSGKLWLFQVRPFVENKGAQRSDYLRSLDPEVSMDMALSLTENLPGAKP